LAELKKNILEKLPYTHKIFFPFPKLTDIQEQTIPIILNKKNALIISPTASGKTEAVVAPICERMIKECNGEFNSKKLLMIYIIPTKALVSDIYKRLESKLSRLHITSASKTGDLNNFKVEQPQNVLFTTPESCDSLLSRNPQILKEIKFIVIDELHFLDNNYRGDQLRILLQRITKIVNNPNELNYYAMSATIKEPNKMCERYFKKFEIIISKGSRKIIFATVNAGTSFKKLEIIKNIFIEEKISRAIFFCNSRKKTNQITKQLIEIFGRKDRIFEHHSSIHKKTRKLIEKEMARTDNILSYCVATSSLEIGIDIGSIQAVVLIEPPLTVSSLLQRIGRGNRRTNKTTCFGIFELPEDKKVFTEMIEKARNGFIEDIKYKSDVSVVVQQILSLTMEKYNEDDGKLTYKKIHEFLDILTNKPEHVDLIIEKMISDDYIQEYRGKIIPTTKLLDFQSKFRMGKSINANISSGNVMQVVDQSGKILGEMEKPTEKMNKIQFASRKWDVSEIQKNKVIVKRTMTGKTSTPNFVANSNYGSWYSSLPDELKKSE
jgi:ATP-dependent helicase Lhr and Lhr-like helicase